MPGRKSFQIRPAEPIALSAMFCCCKTAGIKSQARHCKYKKPGDPFRVFPNLLLSEIQLDGPLQCIVSDMTASCVKGVYCELTLYMDLWSNAIVSHSLSSKRGDCMTYISGPEDLTGIKKKHPALGAPSATDRCPRRSGRFPC